MLMNYFLLYLTAFASVFTAVEFFGIFFERRNYLAKNKLLALPIVIGTSFALLGLNLFGIVIVNLLGTIIVSYLANFAIFKIKIVPSILYSVFLIVLNIGVEFLVYTVILGHTKWFTFFAHDTTNYDAVYDSPLPVALMMILFYIPVIITRHFFKKKTKESMNPSTFVMYLLIPLLNIVIVLTIPALGLDLSEGSFARSGYTFLVFATLVSTYLIFYTFQKHSYETQQKNELLEEKLTALHEQDLMKVSTKALKTRLSVVEDAMENERVLRHDRRHFENMIYSLLQNGDEVSIEKAKSLLEEKINAEPQRLRKWCDNETVNATIEYYVSLAEKNEIPVEASLCVPKDIRVDVMQLSIALGNLLENAIHGNEKLPVEKRMLRIKSMYKKQLLFQIENACAEEVKLNNDGVPCTKELNHGIGTKSVLAFAAVTNSEVLYNVSHGVFTVRMII